MRAVLALLLAAPPALGLVRPVGLRGAARRGTVVACDGPELVGPAHVPLPPILQSLSHAQEAGLGSAALLGATALSLSLANAPATAKAWLAVWDTQLGPAIGAHHLTLRGWINEGLMAIFFFIVGLEMKIEMRVGSLASLRKAALPCIAALGGMVTPMGVYFVVQRLMGGGSMCALTVPMATDIAFAMAVYGLFRKRMPAAASAFLLTLATVDDLGAILVLATCFASHVSLPFLGATAAVTAGLAAFGRTLASDLRAFAAGGAVLWYCLLRSGVNADIAGVLAAFCISTRAKYTGPKGEQEDLMHRAVLRLSPISTFFIMPLFALANTAVPLGSAATASASAAAAAAAKAATAASVAPALGIGAGLLIGKPLGIFLFSLLATKTGLAALPAGMSKSHLGIVGVLGGIGFTMCLLLTEVAMPASQRALPKIVILLSSLVASVIAAAAMRSQPVLASDDKVA